MLDEYVVYYMFDYSIKNIATSDSGLMNGVMFAYYRLPDLNSAYEKLYLPDLIWTKAAFILSKVPANCIVHPSWFGFCELVPLIDQISSDHDVFMKFFRFFCKVFKMSELEMQDYLIAKCGYDFLQLSDKVECKTFDELVQLVGREKAFLAVSEKNPSVAEYLEKLAVSLKVFLERYNWSCDTLDVSEGV